MLEFNAERHEYRYNGRAVVNVTRVLGPLASYQSVPADRLAYKREVGRAVHLATELLDQNRLDKSSIPPEIAGYVKAYLMFKAGTGFAPVDIESKVYSEKYRYAGAVDRVGIFTSLKKVAAAELNLVDLKCTYRLMPAVGPQTAGYAQAWQETYPADAKVKRRWALQLKPDGSYVLEQLSDPSDLSVFLSALTLYNWCAKHRQQPQGSLNDAYNND